MTVTSQSEPSLHPLPSPHECAPWCAKRGRQHRDGWDDIGRNYASRTCERRLGSAPTIDIGGHRFEVAVDRFESVDFGRPSEVGPQKVVLDDMWLSAAAARKLAELLSAAADAVYGVPEVGQ